MPQRYGAFGCGLLTVLAGIVALIVGGCRGSGKGPEGIVFLAIPACFFGGLTLAYWSALVPWLIGALMAL